MKEIWVLLYKIEECFYLIDSVFPDVHTYAFSTEQEANECRKNMVNPNLYWVRKTWLKDS